MTAVRKGRLAVLAPLAPSSLGQPEVDDWASRARKVDLVAMPAAEAVERFNAGAVDLVQGGRLADFPLTRSVGILRGTIQIDPVIGLLGLQVMDDKGFLATPQNREALAMAIDRGKLMGVFGFGGWQPTSRVVAPGLDGDPGTVGERWQQQTIDERRAIASQRVHQWMAAQSAAPPVSAPVSKAHAAPKSPAGSSPATPPTSAPPANGPHLSLWLVPGQGSDMLFDGLAADLATIGVTLERAQEEKGADLVLVDTVARYPQAQWFLDRLSCKASQGLCAPAADALVEQADAATDPAQRVAFLTQAEGELTGANLYIPFGAPIRWSLVRGSVNGFAPNAWGWHPLLPLAWLPK
ncbi:hypothetical protein [Novosphingobium sp. 9]|uniref:hypothetical protein n=1 Tax=Novosphingobium sp. 9 TaxID=2025349 RepID=UPI0021B57799|nr:hypothetical protein [Novosphingobium sp. 9]